MRNPTEERPSRTGEGSRPPRPDVFISYSRTDESFVRRLVAALRERDLEVWVDWEDIRKSADWRTTIERGIESAKAFVSVLSPELAASEICGYESERAGQYNKRFVPIVRREVDRTDLPDELNKPNWIWIRDSDDFDSSLQQLADALANDNDWLDAHARLLVRTGDWERGRRDSSLLLRGGDLRAAEAWLSAQASHGEKATPLQGAYIAASRAAARRRQQIALGLAVAALVALAALAVWALVSRSEAIDQRRVAEQRARIARSRELAASAATQQAVDPALSALLAREAIRVSPTAEAIRALRVGLREPQQKARFQANTAAFDPKGTSVAVGTGRLVVLRTLSGAKIASPLLRHPARVVSIAYGSRNGMLATAAGDGAIRLWRLAETRPIATLSHGRSVQSVAFDRSGRRLLSSGVGPVKVWSIPGGRLLRALPTKGYVNAAISPDGRDVAVAAGSQVTIWSVPSGRVLARIAHPKPVWAVEYSPDGKRLATVAGEIVDSKVVRLWSFPGRKPRLELAFAALAAELAFSPDGQYVLTSARRTGLWRVHQEAYATEVRAEEVVQLPHPSTPDPVAAVAFSRTGQYALTRTASGVARVWWVGGAVHATRSVLRLFAPEVCCQAVTPDGRRGVATLGGELHVRDLSPARTRSVALDGAADALALSPDGVLAATASHTDRGRLVRIWRLGDLRPITSVPYEGGSPVIAFGPAGLLAVGDRDARRVRVVNARTGRVVATTRDVSVWLQFAGRRRLLVSNQAGVALWDFEANEQLDYVPHQSDAWGGDWSGAAGDILVARSTEEGADVVRLWDADTRTFVADFRRGLGSTVVDAELSPNGGLVLIAHVDAVSLWDRVTEERILELPEAEVSEARFMDDGRILVVSPAEARVLTCELCRPIRAVIGLVDANVARRLSAEERARYLRR